MSDTTTDQTTGLVIAHVEDIAEEEGLTAHRHDHDGSGEGEDMFSHSVILTTPRHPTRGLIVHVDQDNGSIGLLVVHYGSPTESDGNPVRDSGIIAFGETNDATRALVIRAAIDAFKGAGEL